MTPFTTTTHPKRIDCSGATLSGDRAPGRDRFLIGHLSRSMLVSRSNTSLGSAARLQAPAKGHLLLVADGLGCEAASDHVVASIARRLVTGVPWFVDHPGAGRTSSMEADLRTTIRQCHEELRQAARSDRDPPAGSTLTAALVLWPRAYVIHLGDSRCYLVREDTCHQVTEDHVRRLSATHRRRRPPADSGDGPHRSPEMITNALGAGIANPRPQIEVLDLALGDHLLLCSASLAGHLSPEAMVRVAQAADSATALTRALLAQGRAAGAKEEATVVSARFTTAPETPAP